MFFIAGALENAFHFGAGGFAGIERVEWA